MTNQANETIAYIGARAGSVRVPGKNMRVVGGMPLIGHTIKQALDSRLFSKIYVNSDDPQVLKYAATWSEAHPSVIAYERPAELGAGNVFVIDVVREMLETIDAAADTTVGVLFPTVPLRSIEDIWNTHDLYRSKQGQFPAISVSKYEYPVHLALENVDGHVVPAFPDFYGKSTRHNDQKDFYRANFSILFNSVARLLTQKNLIGENPLMFETPLERSVDIDEPYQFKIVESFLATSA